MRVLQVNDKFYGAGIENVMRNLGKCLRDRGIETYYATYENVKKDNVFKIKNPINMLATMIYKLDKLKSEKKGELAFHDPNKTLTKILSLNLREFIPMHDPVTEKSFQQIIKKVRPHVVHFHNVLPSLSPIKVAKRNAIPTIASINNYWPICPLSNRMQIKTNKICDEKNWRACNKMCAFSFINVERYMKKLRDFIDKNVDCLIPASNYVKDRLVEYLYPEDRIVTIHNGIDTNIFKPISQSVDPLVIHIGRLSRHKGSHIFFRVAKELKKINPNIKFLLIGSGLNWRSPKIQNIEYLGRISTFKLIGYYSNALCVVIPSIWPEPHPLVTLEAMACSTPVIGSKIAGIEESIIDKKTGYLIDLNNEEKMVKDIAEKIIYLYENKYIRINLGENARKIIKNKFSLQKMTREYIRVYEKITK